MIHHQNKIITKSAEETQSEGEKFAALLNPSDIVLLHGDLGAGKTTFTQGLAKGLGINKRIISPTFVIIRSHEINYSSSERSESRSHSSRSGLNSSRQARTINQFYHIDLYRLETENDIKGSGVLEILESKDSIIAIEWPEKLGSLTPKKRWEVNLKHVKNDEREITVIKTGFKI